MKNQTKKQKGQKLEYYILSKVQEIDPHARLSRGSGCGNDIADIQCSFAFIEAKNWDRYNVIMNMKDWNHLLSQMPINTLKLPIYIFRNNENKNFAILNADDLFMLLKERND